jgi:tetratricopeptide (TPR) repeat protein
MSQPISQPDKWRAVLQQQRLANIEFWLDKLDTCEDLASFVLKEYDNLLHALEKALQQDDLFDLAYHLIRKLDLIVFGYVDWDRWLIYLDEGVQISRRLQREAERAYLMECIGNIHLHRAEIQEAEIIYLETAEIFQRLGEQDRYARSLSRLGQIAYDLHQDLRAGVDLCQQAIHLADQLQNEILSGFCYAALSYVYRAAREWRLCLQAAKTAYEFLQASDVPRIREQLLARIILAHIFLGEWDSVNEEAAQLTELFTANGDIDGLATHKGNLGVAAFKQGNYPLAEALWQEVLSLQSQIQRPFALAMLYNNLGKVYTKMEEWEVAQDFLEKAVIILENIADKPSWANTMDNLVDLYEAQEQFDKCRVILEQVLTQMQDFDLDSPVQELLSNMQLRLQTLPLQT